jgi:hypothetical protein
VKPHPCEIDSPSVVLIGNFNPKIFQPGWLAKYELVSDDAARAATIEIIRPEISAFTVHEELRFVVELGRCIVESKTPRHEQTVLDLVRGCFGLLEHSPIQAMGINRAMHFRMPDEDAWHRLGHRLAPKRSWSGLLEQTGTRSVTIEGKLPGCPATYTVTVEPSSLVPHGVFIRTNEHHAFEPSAGATAPMKTLADRWDRSQASARKFAEELIERCEEENP